MERKHKLLGYYNYTVILTYLGMLTGFFGIIYAFDYNFKGAVFCLMAAGLIDMFDGTVAATRKRTEPEKCFGIQIDSFSDLICFGVLPAVIVYNHTSRNHVILAVCALYLLCALIRLAYFNVDEQERQKHSDSSREIYYGLPVTMSALFLPVVHGAVCLFGLNHLFISPAALLIMSVLFLLPFKVRKPKLLGKTILIISGVLVFWFIVFACKGVL